jgi:branched-subunit amino acid transport protein
MKVWWMMVCCGVLTFVLRLSFIAAEGRMTFPHGFRRVLPLMPVAALTALVMPELLAPHGVWWLSWRNERLVAGVAAILIAATMRSVLWTLAGGFGMLGLWSVLF